MGRIISISNQKGGVGKTTTAINLSACLAENKKKVLLIDMDPQCNATSGLGILKKDVKKTTYMLMLGDCSVKSAISKTSYKNLDIIPSENSLSGVEIELINTKNVQYILKQSIQPIVDSYDYIIIDCPPSLNLLTVNAMTASDSIIVPIQCEYYALEGLTMLMKIIDMVQDKLNPDIVIEGILFTMYDGRTNLSSDVVDNVKSNLNVNIYNTLIPRNIKIAEAPSYGQPINVYDPKSKGSLAYKQFAKEVINYREK